MVKDNKQYNPTKVYNRRIVRSILRATNIRRNGFHRVSKCVHNDFAVFHKHEELEQLTK